MLRPYLPADEAEFYQLIHNNRARLQPAFPAREASVRTPADATLVLRQFRQDWTSGRLYVFGIWNQETQQYLGDISLKPTWTTPVTAEIGYYLAAEAEGQGYAREALAAIATFGFEQLRVARLLIRCRADNPRSCAVAEAAGFHPLPPRPKLVRVFTSQAILYYIRKPEQPVE
ncbi:hypothetical protein GCM10027346_14050 [Hymenobacter seoulensis]